eukprot:10819206-Karenia_brevis.AAC.1
MTTQGEKQAGTTKNAKKVLLLGSSNMNRKQRWPSKCKEVERQQRTSKVGANPPPSIGPQQGVP